MTKNSKGENFMVLIQKRDGRTMAFSKSKIVSAVLKAFKAVDGEITD